ncbi:hypothetical protein DL766_000104 [Monosporascus sp. MC13-8B]|uniref:Ubiquitin 3 binding protein But2 C-terminal domain-containing protein n=1 Tax=Monosporascus cannonballus TaxID=155416 RepID=A0ABY0H9X7_9PEZI|nr:hypothetical protein DL762_005273 [Monosporascus cannonballus]RYO90426.1 hypothetical protein DL763_005346 [Monosporascus cannonballus]RYP40080.1 hypothetical protein DL766_000104 [Monosporascus sp. MC13-8B]
MGIKPALTLAAATGVSSLARRDAGCKFTVNTHGAVEFPVGQHESGQSRAGAHMTLSGFTINDGSVTDAKGRGCWWTPPSMVLQCDENQTPETGFEMGCDGLVSFRGQKTFYECDAGEKDEVNIYLTLDENAQNCHETTLSADGCRPGDCEASSSSSAPATSAPPATSYPVSSPPATCAETPKLSVSTVVTTVTETVSDCGSEGHTETVSGPAETRTVPGPTETKTVPGPTVTETVHGPTQTKTVKYPTETVPGPTETTTAHAPPQTTTAQTTVTYKPSPPPATSPKPSGPETSPAPTTPDHSAPFPAPSEVDIPDSCPGDVKNAGEFNLPTLIIPIDSSKPDVAEGTSYFGEVSETESSVFDFNVPPSAEGKTCKLVFLFPEHEDLETSSFTFSGAGELDFAHLSRPVDQQTSYSNVPDVAEDLGQFTVKPGNAYEIASFNCPAGERVSIEMANIAGGDTSLRFFQDYNPCPIGLFMTTS